MLIDKIIDIVNIIIIIVGFICVILMYIDLFKGKDDGK